MVMKRLLTFWRFWTCEWTRKEPYHSKWRGFTTLWRWRLHNDSLVKFFFCFVCTQSIDQCLLYFGRWHENILTSLLRKVFYSSRCHTVIMYYNQMKALHCLSPVTRANLVSFLWRYNRQLIIVFTYLSMYRLVINSCFGMCSSTWKLLCL